MALFAGGMKMAPPTTTKDALISSVGMDVVVSPRLQPWIVLTLNCQHLSQWDVRQNKLKSAHSKARVISISFANNTRTAFPAGIMRSLVGTSKLLECTCLLAS